MTKEDRTLREQAIDHVYESILKHELDPDCIKDAAHTLLMLAQEQKNFIDVEWAARPGN